MDVFDRASEQEQLFRDQVLAAHAANRLHGTSATHCQAYDCGIEIPEQRRQALPGVQFCIDCAARQEKERTGR
jgi:phage/conjugal plasmid C-4 type zinc finger TraR family protein